MVAVTWGGDVPPWLVPHRCVTASPLQMSAIASGILTQNWPFYYLYGMPPAESGDGGASSLGDAHWADDLTTGAFVDWLNPEGRWVTATVTDVSPTGTEVCVQEDGQSPEWLSVDSERLAPLGQGKKKARGEDGTADGKAASPADDAWRSRLRRGYMCDAQDSSKKWYVAMVVEHKEDDGVITAVKVRRARKA